MQASHPLLGKKLLVITAHPDDESYVMAGTLAANAKAGGQTMLVCATRGEKGTAHVPRPTTALALAKRRIRELHAACAALSVQHVQTFALPDGGVATHKAELVRIAMRAAKQFQPNIVVSFGPCGITGHRDHIAAGEVARAVARRLRVPFAAAVLSPKLQREAKKFLASRRHAPHYSATTKFVSPNCTLRISALQKRRALRCHRSQMDGGKLFTSFPTYVVHGLLNREYFRIWQPR